MASWSSATKVVEVKYGLKPARGEAALRMVIQSYLAHYHHERNHQGLGNQLIVPEPGMEHQHGLVMRRERLGGLLSYYHREVA